MIPRVKLNKNIELVANNNYHLSRKIYLPDINSTLYRISRQLSQSSVSNESDEILKTLF